MPNTIRKGLAGKTKMYKQIIIARKDLDMSPGKLAAQVSHASMAFLTNQIKERTERKLNKGYSYHPAITRELKIDESGEGKITSDNEVRQQYRRADLDKYSRDAFERGERGFFTKQKTDGSMELELCFEPEFHYECTLEFDKDLYEEWILGSFTKVTLEARNKNQLLKAVEIAEVLGMKEGVDFFLIKDNCYTELEPEEVDENGVGRTLTCIGFRPMNSEVIDQIGRKYHIYT